MKSDIDELIVSFIDKKLSGRLRDMLSTNKASVAIDMKNDIDSFSPELGDYVLGNPEEALENIKHYIDELGPAYKQMNLEVRLKGLPETCEQLLREIRSKHIGRLVQTKGLIRLATSVRPIANRIDFECQLCGYVTKVPQPEAEVKAPSVCPGCGKSGRFKIEHKELIDQQRIALEEAPEDLEGGAQPEHMDVYLKGDLVEPKFERNIVPGNKVIVSGIIKERSVLVNGKRLRNSEIFIEALYIEPAQLAFEDIEVSKADEAEIKALANDKLIYNKFRDSIAPNIFGYDHVKEAIVMQLFGGVRKENSEGTEVKRGDVHILLVGDPGTAKSAMLRYVSGIAPKSRYVTGMGASKAGITATIQKDETTKAYVLEAGALPLTSDGLLALDEIDKMNEEDRQALHEGLEQQTISISKANIHATLTARTSVLAAANPKLGRFDQYTAIASQIDLLPTLISRFDLIFIMRDKKDLERDKRLVEMILESNKNLDKNKPPIDTSFMKKYIAYAKRSCKPKLSEEASKAIEEFFLKMRGQSYEEGEGVRPIAITPRQIDALVRLTEASAKVRLSEYATMDDARRAIDLTSAYLGDVGYDPSTGKYDIDRIVTGISTSKRGNVITVRSIIKAAAESLPKGQLLSISKIVEDAAKRGISKDDAEEAVQMLKKEGEIFEPKNGFVQLLG